MPNDSRREQLVGIGVILVAAATWMMFLVPSLALWAMHRPAASMEKVGAGAALFWIGVLVACGVLFEWSLFTNSYKMRIAREWFGERGARWFYAGLGGCVSLMGLGVTISAGLYSLFGTSVGTQERPDFAGQVATPARPLPAGFSSPPPPPGNVAGNAPLSAVSASAASPPPPPPTRNDFSELPGEWRYLEGGYCVKIPASIVGVNANRQKTPDSITQSAYGCTVPGKPEGVNFAVRVTKQAPRPDITVTLPKGIHAPDGTKRIQMPEVTTRLLYDSMLQRGHPTESNPELIMVNGLEVLKTTTQSTQPGALRRDKLYTLYGTEYKLADGGYSVSVSVYSQLPRDHEEQQRLLPYLNTLQRIAPPADPSPEVASAQGEQWEALEGGFRIRTTPDLEFSLNSATVEDWTGVKKHHLRGQTADKVEFTVDVQYQRRWDHPNDAHKTVAFHAAHPSRETEYAAVDINGMTMLRITQFPRWGPGSASAVDYRYQEGQYQITMEATSKLPLDHPSFRSVLRFLESIERMPASQ